MKGKTGIRASLATREECRSQPHQAVVVHDTPQHAAGMNPSAIWFAILARKVVSRGHFRSKAPLRDKLLAFIDYFNATMAKPFTWTCQGTPLVA